jgi:polar amino acid transport system substrate-binding protein
MGLMWWRSAVLALVLCSQWVLADSVSDAEHSKRASYSTDPVSSISTTDFLSLLNDKELAWLVANPVVTVGPDPYFHPIEFFDEQGQYQGLSADYLALIAKRTGITFAIEQRENWQQVINDVKVGKIDMMAANVPSIENTHYLSFTDNYFSFPSVLVTAETSLADVVSLTELSGRKVAVVAGYPDEEYLSEQHPDIEQIRVDSVVKGLEAVANKQADALLSFLPTVSYFMDQEGFSGLKITSVRVRFGGAFAVKKQWPELVSILDKALATISTQERNEIVRRWVTFQEDVDATGLTDSEIAWLEGISEVRLGIDNSWAPFEYRDALGTYKGISSDYISEISKWLEIPFNADQNLPWSEVLAKVRRGELDVLPAVAKTPSRERYLEFTKPYMTFPIVLMTSLDAPLVNSISDFDDGRVAVVRNYAASEYMQQDYPDYSFLFVDSVEEGVQKLASGEVDGFVGNMAAISYTMQSLGVSKIKIATTTGRELALAMAVRKDWPQMVPILQKSLDRFTKAQKQNIHNSWINVRVETRSDWGFIIKVSAAIATVLLMFMAIVVWKNKQLAAEVEERKRIGDDLKLLTLAVEQSPVSILITDSLGDIIYVNPTCEKVAGYPRDALIGNNPRMMKSERNVSSLYDELWQTITSGKTWRGEYFNCRADGSEYLVDSTIVPIRLANGDISHYLEIKLDVTQQRDDEARLRTFEKFVENSQQGLGMASLDGEITFVNRALSTMLGESTPEAAIGQRFASYYEGEVGETLKGQVLPELMTSGSWSGELALTSRQGKLTPTLDSFFVIHHEDGTPQYLADVITDISEQKQIQLELEAAQMEAERATQIKSEFLAKMSHEIRTPMNAIIGMSHLALRTDLDEKQRDYISKSYQAAQSLLGLINDILDFSKIESGKLELESIEFDLEEVFSNLSNLCVEKASEKGLEVIFAIDPHVPVTLIGDPLRIGQVLLNLTTNAIKFTNSGQIFIEVTKGKTTSQDVELLFTVSDTGIGLTQQQMDKLFHSFQQADNSTTRQYGGTGLGLSICKSLVQLMRGDITVSSVKGIGSQFQFNIRLEQSEAKQEKSFAVPPTLTNMPVMVVDDNDTAREVISTYLSELKLKVDSFADGKAALDALSAGTTDYKIIFLDWMMPGMTGLEVAEKIKSSSVSPCPKIIMVTSYGREDVIHSAQQLGLDSFLVKPVNQSMLFDAIVSTLDRGSLDPTINQQGAGIGFEGVQSKATNSLSGKTILLVEDNEINQQIAKELLENVGATVDVADNGALAIEQVEMRAQTSLLYHAVIMDLRMPVMDGIEATKILRQRYSKQELPIIFMTADAMKGVQESVLAVGASDYITKPIDPDALMRVLHQHVQVEKVNIVDASLDSNQLTDSTPWLDVNRALMRVSGNESLYRGLLEKFVAQFSGTNEQLQAAFEAQQWETLCLTTHTLKGVSANIGADRLQSLAQELEQASLDKNQTELQLRLPELNQVLERSMREVKRWLEVQPTSHLPRNEVAEVFDQSQCAELLHQLANACAASKATVAKDLANKLMGLDFPESYRSSVTEIVTAVNKYRFKEAYQLINGAFELENSNN